MNRVNEINSTLAKGAMPAMEAGVIVHLGSEDMKLIVRLLGEVDTRGKARELLAALHTIRISELTLKDFQVAEEGHINEVCLTDVYGGEVSCEGYRLKVVSLFNSRDKVVSTSMLRAFSSFCIELPIDKRDGSEMGDG